MKSSHRLECWSCAQCLHQLEASGIPDKPVQARWPVPTPAFEICHTRPSSLRRNPEQGLVVNPTEADCSRAQAGT